MQKIADTVSGNVLIEMSVREWEYLQRKPEATIHEMRWNNLNDWRVQFLNGLNKLNRETLGTRVYNSLLRSSSIIKNDTQTEEKIEPKLRSKWTFETDDGELLGFEEWCDYILEDTERFYSPMVGEVGIEKLIDAIAEYRKNDLQHLR